MGSFTAQIKNLWKLPLDSWEEIEIAVAAGRTLAKRMDQDGGSSQEHALLWLFLEPLEKTLGHREASLRFQATVK